MVEATDVEKHLTLLAVIAIGRNEGARLKKCLLSAKASELGAIVVYVDSGSTDDSVAVARQLDCEVLNLDLSIPFTAARARNEGFALALQREPRLTHVQFVDGDCELVSGWLEIAIDHLLNNPSVAAVCGRRRERYPDSSIYNQLCDIEWNTPVGVAKSCGGDVMMRVDAFKESGGYRASLIAGEEPELCVRLRAKGWSIWRLDHEMTLHDASMHRFGQWWNRNKRAGFAFAEGAYLHGAPPERHWVQESRSAWLWGLILPLVALIFSLAMGPFWLTLLLVYPTQALRLFWREHKKLPKPGWYAIFLVLGKFPEMLGQVKYVLGRVLGNTSKLIEYK